MTITAFHASKVEERVFSEWAQENKISFPVGAIQGNEAKTRLTWGVKSLPWLILADKQHMVVAEGFGIGDIDGQLAGVEDK